MADFVPYMKELQDIFQIKKEFLNLASDELANVARDYSSKNHATSSEDVVLIGIHARRKTYKFHLHQMYNLTLVDEEYFLHAMDFYKAKFKVFEAG